MALFQHLHATPSSPRLLIAVGHSRRVAVVRRGGRPDRMAAAATAGSSGIVRLIAAGGVALLIEALVSMFFAFHPRPFAAGFGPAWVAHAANNSMPSTHVAPRLTIMAMGLAMRRYPRASAVVAALAVALLAWARIYVGIHWPADMLGAALSAIVSVALVYGVEYGISTCMKLRRKRALAQRPQEPSIRPHAEATRMLASPRSDKSCVPFA
ncbi:phosphatase PAP2 family protein [Rhodanobacter lindaniclasticus]